MADDPVHGRDALANGIEKLIGHVDACHHVLEDEYVVLEFCPLAGSERKGRTADGVGYQLACGVHTSLSHRETIPCIHTHSHYVRSMIIEQLVLIV
jgi:hypothetical protein